MSKSCSGHVATGRNSLKPLESSSNFLGALHLDESIVNTRASFLYNLDSGSLTFYYKIFPMYACHALVQSHRISASVLNETFEALSSNCI